jgi:hypothetical protein
MRLSEELDELLEQGRSTVEKYISDEGTFPLFALALKEDDEVTAVLASNEFSCLEDGIGEVLKVLLPLAANKEVVATLICSPIPKDVAEAGWCAAVFDLESKQGSRLYGVLPYRKHDYLGWQYGTIEYSQGKPQIFVS